MIELTCSICGAKMLAAKIGETIATWLIHMIDSHWPLMEDVHATTQDPESRVRLTEVLRSQPWAI